ncbi:MAG TPA: hypothetical protein VHK90_17300 [Thermoanaerobaculia bacterium]|nr:hypothetical protein [Thermoanaerobaculia bacterium]
MNRAALVLLLLVACAAPPPRVEETVVLLPVAPETAHLRRARIVFDEWLLANRRTRNATFRVLHVGEARSSGRERFAVTIPPSWKGTNAIAARDAFFAQAGELFDIALRDGRALSLGSRPSIAPVQTRIITIPDRDSRDVRWVWTSRARVTHAAVVCDRSPSAGRSACTPDAVLRAMDAWLASNGIAAGVSFRVWIVGRSIGDATSVFIIDTPDLPIADRAVYLLGARNEIAGALARDVPRVGSDVVGATTAAVAELTGRRGRKALYVLSDLRLSAGPFSFDRRVPPPDEFLRWLTAEHLLPDCSDVAITACGLHFRTTPGTATFDASSDAEVRAAWMAAFAAMRAASVEIRGACETERFIDPKGGA